MKRSAGGPGIFDVARLGAYGYTVDGGMMGELEQECFDAWELNLVFHGRNVHPGYAKNRLVNAAAIAARFVSDLPECEFPEHAHLIEKVFFI